MKSRLVKILFIVAVALLLLKSGVSAAIYLWPKPDIDTTGSIAAQQLIQLTNDYRRTLGLSELIVNPRLTQAAVNKAKDIIAKQYFSHTSPEGKKFSEWVKEVGYDYFYVGENLAIDFATPQEVFSAWLNSPKHKENIVRPEFQEIGLADLKGQFDGRETDVVVQLFGSRVLGANEMTTTSNNLPVANNYFGSDASSAPGYFGSIDNYLNYILFFVVLILVITVIVRKLRRKKLPQKVAAPANGNINRISARKKAPALISLYTKRTLTRNARSRTSKNT